MENALEKICVGQFRLTGTVDATDPCYSKGIWCRKNDIPVVPGTYDCYVTISDEGEWGDRVKELQIVHEDYNIHPYDDWDCIAQIGVDSGLAGFYSDKPDYTDDEWSEFCYEISDKDYLLRPEGVCSSSGYGDGGYYVEGVSANGRYIALRIVFIED